MALALRSRPWFTSSISKSKIDRAAAADSPWVSTAPFVVEFAIVFLAYFAAGKLGQATTNIRSSNLGPVWPAYGVALASLLAYGYRVWPAIVMSAFVVALEGSVPWPGAAGQATSATLATCTGTWLLRRIPDFDPTLPRLRDAFGFIVAAMGSAIISAALGMLSLYATGIQPYTGLDSAWLIYWLGDATGALLVTPLVFTVPNLLRLARGRQFRLAALALVTVAASLIVFSDFVPARMFAFSMLPIVMFAAIGFGMGGTTLCLFLVAATATLVTGFGIGPFSVNTPMTNAVLLDLYFIVLVVPCLPFASVIAERERADRQRDQLIREQAEAEARLRHAAIVESSDDAIISEDLNGLLLSWNRSASILFDAAEEQAVGCPIDQLLPSELLCDDRTTVESLRNGAGMVQFESIRATGADSKQYFASTISPLRDASGNLVGKVRIIRDITRRKHAEEALTRARRKLIGVQEQERARIARELHDDIGQRLALLTVGLTGVSEHLQAQAAEIASDIQSLSHDLHPSRIELLGVVRGMRGFCREFSGQHQMNVRFDATGVPSDLPSDVGLSLFRVLQEALHNAAKHSLVRECDVRVWQADGCVHLIVSDKGAGFNVDAVRENGGIGLVTMQERMHLVDGELSIESRAGSGTAIHARVPLTGGSSADA